MRHARDDYNRIQDPAVQTPSLLKAGATAIGEDEPVFLIRAQDKTAAEAVRAYARLAKANGAAPALVSRCLDWVTEIEIWQATHTAKTPDL